MTEQSYWTGALRDYLRWDECGLIALTLEELCEAFTPTLREYPYDRVLTLEPLTYYVLRFSLKLGLAPYPMLAGENGGVIFLGREWLLV